VVRFPAWARDFSLLCSVHVGCGIRLDFYPVHTGGFSPVAKRPDRETGHQTPLVLITLCLIMHMYKFTAIPVVRVWTCRFGGDFWKRLYRRCVSEVVSPMFRVAGTDRLCVVKFYESHFAGRLPQVTMKTLKRRGDSSAWHARARAEPCEDGNCSR
jgi:hypothetical protein